MKLIFFWKHIPLSDRTQLPHRPGLYAVKSLGRVMYIGKSVNLHDRWQGTGHHRYPQANRLAFPRLAYIELPKGQIDSRETALIRRVNPPWNGKPVPKRDRWVNLVFEALAVGVACYLVERHWQDIIYLLGSFGPFG